MHKLMKPRNYRKTEVEMLEYIKVLEWKIDDLQGIGLTSPS
jgi:hypothetical protein